MSDFGQWRWCWQWCGDVDKGAGNKGADDKDAENKCGASNSFLRIFSDTICPPMLSDIVQENIFHVAYAKVS